MTRTRRPRRPAGWQTEFIERTAALSDMTGLPPSVLQVFSWLIVSEPAEQSAEDIHDVLGLSAGAISSATTTLVRMGMIERITQPGQRRLFYRVRPGAWDHITRLRLEATMRMRAIVDDAIERAPKTQSRLAEMRDVYAYFEESLTRLVGGRPRRRPVKG